jgi:hypothetical protein
VTALPPPINGTETYLAAVLDRLGEVLDRMPQRPPKPEAPADGPETVELREPVTQPKSPSRAEAATGAPVEALQEPAPTATRTARKRNPTKKGS